MSSQNIEEMLSKHPCYNEEAHKKFARMHLPVAPKCNIQCNFCNRKYDCTNESRPGVTSEVLSPEDATTKVSYVRDKVPNLSVLGIAGPGDPLANEETFRTLELINKDHPDLTFCLSTNGLNLPENVERLKALNVNFITVTLDAEDPEIGSKIYDFVTKDGKQYRGLDAAKILLKNQLEGIQKAVNAGMTVKLNVVLIPTINDKHIPEIAKKAKEMGVYIVNVLPLIPVPGTKFENLRAPTPSERKAIQDQCGEDIRMMRHCKQCRADAIGLLGEDRSQEFACISKSCMNKESSKEWYNVAVATSDGENVDLHFGQASAFHTYKIGSGKIIECATIDMGSPSDIPVYGKEHFTKLEKTVGLLAGMDAVIAEKFGEPVLELLRKYGIAHLESRGSLQSALEQMEKVLKGEDLIKI